MCNPFRILSLLATRLPVRAITDVTPIDFTRACLYQCRKPPAKSGGATSASCGMSENDVRSQAGEGALTFRSPTSECSCKSDDFSHR